MNKQTPLKFHGEINIRTVKLTEDGTEICTNERNVENITTDAMQSVLITNSLALAGAGLNQGSTYTGTSGWTDPPSSKTYYSGAYICLLPEALPPGMPEITAPSFLIRGSQLYAADATANVNRTVLTQLPATVAQRVTDSLTNGYVELTTRIIGPRTVPALGIVGVTGWQSNQGMVTTSALNTGGAYPALLSYVNITSLDSPYNLEPIVIAADELMDVRYRLWFPTDFSGGSWSEQYAASLFPKIWASNTSAAISTASLNFFSANLAENEYQGTVGAETGATFVSTYNVPIAKINKVSSLDTESEVGVAVRSTVHAVSGQAILSTPIHKPGQPLVSNIINKNNLSTVPFNDDFAAITTGPIGIETDDGLFNYQAFPYPQLMRVEMAAGSPPEYNFKLRNYLKLSRNTYKESSVQLQFNNNNDASTYAHIEDQSKKVSFSAGKFATQVLSDRYVLVYEKTGFSIIDVVNNDVHMINTHTTNSVGLTSFNTVVADPVPVTLDPITDVFTTGSHPYQNGDKVILTVDKTNTSPVVKTAALPTSATVYTEDTPLYVIEASAGSFKLSATLGGIQIDFIDDGTGNLSVLPYLDFTQATELFSSTLGNNNTTFLIGSRHRLGGLFAVSIDSLPFFEFTRVSSLASPTLTTFDNPCCGVYLKNGKIWTAYNDLVASPDAGGFVASVGTLSNSWNPLDANNWDFTLGGVTAATDTNVKAQIAGSWSLINSIKVKETPLSIAFTVDGSESIFRYRRSDETVTTTPSMVPNSFFIGLTSYTNEYKCNYYDLSDNYIVSVYTDHRTYGYVKRLEIANGTTVNSTSNTIITSAFPCLLKSATPNTTYCLVQAGSPSYINVEAVSMSSSLSLVYSTNPQSVMSLAHVRYIGNGILFGINIDAASSYIGMIPNHGGLVNHGIFEEFVWTQYGWNGSGWDTLSSNTRPIHLGYTVYSLIPGVKISFPNINVSAGIEYAPGVNGRSYHITLCDGIIKDSLLAFETELAVYTKPVEYISEASNFNGVVTSTIPNEASYKFRESYVGARPSLKAPSGTCFKRAITAPYGSFTDITISDVPFPSTDINAGSQVTFTLSGTVVNATAHKFKNGDAVYVNSSGTLPDTLSVPTNGAPVYYVRNTTTNTFELSSTPSGTIITYNTALIGTAFVVPATVTTGTACTADIVNNRLHTLTHHFENGDEVHIRLAAGGVLPTGIVEGSTYYVKDIDVVPNTFKLSATAGGPDIDLDGTPNGTLFVCGKYQTLKFRPVGGYTYISAPITGATNTLTYQVVNGFWRFAIGGATTIDTGTTSDVADVTTDVLFVSRNTINNTLKIGVVGGNTTASSDTIVSWNNYNSNSERGFNLLSTSSGWGVYDQTLTLPMFRPPALKVGKMGPNTGAFDELTFMGIEDYTADSVALVSSNVAPALSFQQQFMPHYASINGAELPYTSIIRRKSSLATTVNQVNLFAGSGLVVFNASDSGTPFTIDLLQMKK